jgi:hypothetical protein
VHPSDRSSEIGQRIPARFDPDQWEEDLARSTPAGRQAAQDAHHDYEPDGVPLSHLKACEAEGRDGTALPDSVKIYLPRTNGRFGMVFHAITIEGKLHLHYLAFGVRHHPTGSHAPTVYQIAHRRLHA